MGYARHVSEKKNLMKQLLPLSELHSCLSTRTKQKYHFNINIFYNYINFSNKYYYVKSKKSAKNKPLASLSLASKLATSTEEISLSLST